MRDSQYAEEMREVFGWFGRAVHDAQMLEFDMLTLVLTVAGQNGSATTETALRRLESQLDRHTLGRLIRELVGKGVVSSAAEEQWMDALDCRNKLIHRFFLTYAGDLYDADRCAELVAQLRDASARFVAVDLQVKDAVNALMEQIGMPKGDFESLVQEELSRFFDNQES